MKIENKNYWIKIFDKTGNPIDTLDFFSWTGIKMQINAGQGQFTFTVPAVADSDLLGVTLKKNNRVEMWVADRDTDPSGICVYSGWISSRQPSIKSGKEKITVYCMGYLSKLAVSLGRKLNGGGNIQVSSIMTDGTGITAQPDGTAAVATDTEKVFKGVIDAYRAIATNPVINYGGTIGTATSTLFPTSTQMSYVFNERYFLEMLKDCLTACPANWYFYAHSDNLINLRQSDTTTPDHTFTFKKDFHNIDLLDNVDTVVNNVLFESNNEYVKMLRLYRDSASDDEFDDRWTISKDNSVVSTATADNIGNSTLNSNKDEKLKLTIEIIDNNVQNPDFVGFIGYDIESIRPGQTCKLANLSDNWVEMIGDTPLVIASLDYNAGVSTVYLEEIPENTARDAVQAKRDAQIAQGTSGQSTVNTLTTIVFSAGRDGCYLARSAAFSVPNASLTPVLFDNATYEIYDPAGVHDPTTNSGRVTIPTNGDGAYHISASWRWADSTGGSYRIMELHKSGAMVHTNTDGKDSGGRASNTLDWVINLVAGDYIEIKAQQDSGGALNLAEACLTVRALAAK